MTLNVSGHLATYKHLRPALRRLGLLPPKVKKPVAPKVQKLRAPKVKSEANALVGLKAFDLRGKAWLETELSKPIIFVFGVASPKRRAVAEYFADFRVAYPRKGMPWKEMARNFSKFPPHAFVSWGTAQKQMLTNYAARKSIPVWKGEDGLLRQNDARLQSSRASSLNIDVAALFSDLTQSAALEGLISEVASKHDSSLIERAKRSMAIISFFALSKHSADQRAKLKRIVPSDQRRVLIIGQMEADASIVPESRVHYSNSDIVRIARDENPGAEIIYLPLREGGDEPHKGFAKLRDIASLCTIIPADYDLDSVLESVDHVYTISSLLGFEALTKGRKVSVFGNPFYAGWGLTDDRLPMPDRTARPTLEEVFAAAYILHSKYSVGSLGSATEIEHAAMALALEKGGIPRVLAEKVASVHSAESIDAERIAKVLAALNSKPFLVEGGELFATGEIEFLEPLLASPHALEGLVDHFVARVVQGWGGERNLEKIRALLQAGADGGALAVLTAIKPNMLLLADTPHLVGCLVQGARLSDAEEILNRKVETLSPPISVGEISPLLEAYELLRVWQGKFGRKPLNAGPLWQFFQAELPWLREDPQFLNVLPHVFSHLAHFRMIEETKAFVEELLGSFDNDDMHSLMQSAVACAKALFAASRRPEVKVYPRYRIGMYAFKSVEAKVHSYYQNKKSGIPLTIRMQLLQMAVIVEDSASMQAHKKVVFERFAKTRPTKGETAELKKAASLYVNRLFYARRYAEARSTLASIKNALPEEYYLGMVSNCYVYEREYSKALAISLSLLKKYGRNSYRRKIAAIHANSGALDQAAAWLDIAAAEKTSSKESAAIREDLARINFLRESSRILASAPQPQIPKGVIFLGSWGCLNNISMTVPVLLELKRRGYAAIQLDEGMIRNESTGIEWIDKHAGMIDRVVHSDFNILDGLKNEWIVNWSEKRVEAEGINFYQGIFEILTQKFRAFNFDINDPGIYRWFRHYLVRCDQALSACVSIRKEILERGMPVRFINAGSHSAPFSVYRAFALHYAEKYDVGFIHMGPAYENYYTNLKSKVATTVSLDNLTKYPLYRLPFLARPDRFEKWLEQDGLYERYRSDIEHFLNHNRVGRSEQATQVSSYEERIRVAKDEGKKIIGVYGKILCDMAVPFDGGPGHEHIVDWLRHTVTIAKSTDNLIVLKPHPHELRPEIARDLNEYWLDLIEDLDIPSNVVVLPHQGFNNQDLIRYLDLAVLWNGTSSLELCAQGVPVVMASHFGKHDYPIELIYPNSRSDYEEIIRAKSWERPDKAKMERAALLLKYMGTEEVCVPFNYSHRPITNDPVGVPYWHANEIEKFLQSGDPHISRLADKVFV